MTRINCVPPQELTRQHLLAEWRELPRVFALAQKAAQRGVPVRAPQVYTLGAGHVKFFYARLAWCMDRFQALRRELLARGYAPSYVQPPEVHLPREWWGEWTPDAQALELNRARIAQRLQEASS